MGSFSWMTPSMAHLGLSTILLVLAYVSLTSRWSWGISVVACLINVIGLAAYHAIDRMTGAGFNEAALYHIITAWSDAHLLWTFPSFRALLLVVCLLVVAGVFAIRRRPLGLLRISGLSQALIAGAMGFFTLYTAPLAADVMFTFHHAGVDMSDEIGLEGVLAQASPVSRTPHAKPKNLIVLYAESLEQAVFDENVLPGLMVRTNKLIASGTHFRDVTQAPMSGWTIAGMIASQCGVPLSSHRLVNQPNDFGKLTRSFNCLANHLTAQNYHQVYMGGASIQFAGKGDFYRNMRFDEVLGLDELRTPNSPTSEWGLHDDELFGLVKDKIRSLRAKEQPFALMLLTLDTHAPKGHDTPLCQRSQIRFGDGSSQALNRVHCADTLLSTFLGELVRDHLQDTTIVLLSDHLMMGGDVNDELVKRGAYRKNHMVIWDKDLQPGVISRPSNQFDLGPTMLHVLFGQPLRMGFGRSLLKNEPTLMAEHGEKRIHDSVHAWRTASWSRW